MVYQPARGKYLQLHSYSLPQLYQLKSAITLNRKYENLTKLFNRFNEMKILASNFLDNPLHNTVIIENVDSKTEPKDHRQNLQFLKRNLVIGF